MVDPIQPSQPIHIGLKKEGEDAKLTISKDNVCKEIECRVVGSGMIEWTRSAFLSLTGWIAIKYDGLGKDLHVFIKTADLEALQKQGVNLSLLSESQKTARYFSNAFSTSESLSANIEKFFGADDEMVAQTFLMRLQECLDSGSKRLNLDGLFDDKGRCPDIFDNPQLRGLEDLSLKGVQDLPKSMHALQHLKKLNISQSSLTNLPDWFKELKSLETLDLSYSGMTRRQEMLKKGKEHLGGLQERDDQDYVDKGLEIVVGDLFDKLQSLTDLKTIYMKSDDCKLAAVQLQLKFNKIDRKINLF